MHMEASTVCIKSTGGGTGTYSHADGDVPVSIFQNAVPAKTFNVSGQELHKSFDVKILATKLAIYPEQRPRKRAVRRAYNPGLGRGVLERDVAKR